MKKSGFLGLIFPIVILFFFACDEKRVYENYYPLPSSGWAKDSVETFQFPVFDTKSKYNLFINVRNDINYPYSNLWLFIEMVQPDGEAHNRMFEIHLAEPSGRWLGSGFGGIKSLKTAYQLNFMFPVPGNYKFNIRQGMREEKLKGIRDIGFRVEK